VIKAVVAVARPLIKIIGRRSGMKLGISRVRPIGEARLLTFANADRWTATS
jgi:hypothetical protein